MNERELEILKFWQENQIFKQSLAKPSPQGEFVFYEGPPTANGRPGIHHLAARAFKDVIPRYQTMAGFHVRRKAGWDTHGLPVELAVEKQLDLKSKKEIEQYGIAAFNQKCRESVWQYVDEWQKFTERIGFWLDQKDPYITYTNNYIESVWAILKQAEDKKLLYKDYKVVPWCPRCGTALSSHELAQGYADVTDLSLYVKFKIKGISNAYFLAWTTTPWTLPGNLALAVGPEITYVEAKIGDEILVLAKDRLSVITGSYEIIAEHKGSEMVGMTYESIYPYVKTPEFEGPGYSDKIHKIYTADFVTTEDGTGIVHTAVMYGQEDFELGTEIGLPKTHIVYPDGSYVPGTGWLAGRSVIDDNLAVDILKDLQNRNLLLGKENHTHSYPFCWRCKTRLIYYARDSWYIAMSKLRDQLVKENKKIDWEPEHIKEGRFGEWLAEVKDWAISRERYWATPLPVWQSEAGKRVVIGSLEELKRYTKKSGNHYWVMRHGEGEHQIANIYSNALTDEYHLTPKGREQVSQVANQLKAAGLTRLIASPVLRCQETAEILSQVLGLPVETDSRLRELDFGQFAHHQTKEFNNWLEHTANYFTDVPAGGESLLEAKKRFGELLYDYERKLKGEKILFVTHTIGFEALTQISEGAGNHRSAQISRDLSAEPAEVREIPFVPLPHNENYELDLHRPFIDDLQLVDEQGTPLKRVTEVLDVWFDSGAMPFAQDHYPFDFAQGKPLAGQDLLYPADYISEAIDQTRGWFYTLLAIGVLVGRGVPYKNVISLGHLLDKEGKKMSKSVGNVVDPWVMIERYGVDALRYWMYTINPPGESKNFDERTVDEVVKKVFNPLLNVLQFYGLYAGDYKPRAVAPESSHLLDRWIIALLNQLIEKATYHLDHYQIFEAARLFRDFIAELSQWYLRRSRDRFKSGDNLEREQAVATTHFVLITLTKLLAPFTPFLAESLYQQLKSAADVNSVHLADWPVARVATDEPVLTDMSITRELVSAALEARAKAGIKVRQPLASITLKDKRLATKPEFQELIRDEVNVKEVLFDETIGEQVLLDTTLTPELELEGKARDLIRAIQELRKEAKLRPADKISLELGVDYQPVWGRFGDEITATCGIAKVVKGEGETLRIIS